MVQGADLRLMETKVFQDRWDNLKQLQHMSLQKPLNQQPETQMYGFDVIWACEVAVILHCFWCNIKITGDNIFRKAFKCYITFTVLDSQLYIGQAIDTSYVWLWGQKMMYSYYAFCSPEWEVEFARLWNFTIYCFPETKTNLLEIFLQLRLYVPWCSSLGQSPDRCKKILLISHFELSTSVYLGLHLSIASSLGKSCRERFIHAETVCMNGNSFLDGEQQYLNSYYMTANII